MKALTILVAAAGLTFAAALPGGVRSQEAASPDLAKGERDYQETGCYACHGTVGHGGAWQGPKLAPDPLPYPLFLRQLRQPSRSMPRYSEDVLSDAEVANIYAWLKAVPRGKPADEIGLLQTR